MNKNNPMSTMKPFHIVTGDVSIFEGCRREELEWILEAMVEWEHYQSAAKIKRALDRLKTIEGN